MVVVDFWSKMYQKQNSILNHKRVLKSMQTVQLSKLGQGSYILILHLNRPERIAVGKLGKCSFPAGYYTYVGSALGPGGLASRLKHHLHTTADVDANLRGFEHTKAPACRTGQS